MFSPLVLYTTVKQVSFLSLFLCCFDWNEEMGNIFWVKLMRNKTDTVPSQVDVQWQEEGQRNGFIKKQTFF